MAHHRKTLMALLQERPFKPEQPRTRSGSQKARVSDRIRLRVYLRDDWACRYCGKRNLKNPTLDHVVPRSAGGLNTAANLVTACLGCNRQKQSNRSWRPRAVARREVLEA